MNTEPTNGEGQEPSGFSLDTLLSPSPSFTPGSPDGTVTDAETDGADEGDGAGPGSGPVTKAQIRTQVRQLMGLTGVRPSLGVRAPIAAPAGCTDVRAWTEAVFADTWDRNVALLSGPGGVVSGIVALREVESFLGGMAARIRSRMRAIDEDGEEAAELWANPHDESEESQELLGEQRSYQAGLYSARERAEDRLEYVEFQIGIVRSVLWNYIGHGGTAEWSGLEEEFRAEVVDGTAEEREEAEVHVGRTAKHAALFIWTMDNREPGRREIATPTTWEDAVEKQLMKMFKAGDRRPLASSMWTMISRVAKRKYPEEWSGGDVEDGGEPFSHQVAAVRKVAELYEGPRDDDEGTRGRPTY